jgi:hypothetical protein
VPKLSTFALFVGLRKPQILPLLFYWRGSQKADYGKIILKVIKTQKPKKAKKAKKAKKKFSQNWSFFFGNFGFFGKFWTLWNILDFLENFGFFGTSCCLSFRRLHKDYINSFSFNFPTPRRPF